MEILNLDLIIKNIIRILTDVIRNSIILKCLVVLNKTTNKEQVR